MTTYAFDANIIIDALLGRPAAHEEFRRATADGTRQAWISRMAWMEVLSKGDGRALRDAEYFLTAFGMIELTASIAARAAALRRARPRLRSPDAIILASAQQEGHILVTRNTRDFPPDMPGIRIPYTL